jgi:hydroxymethylbilane synthase
VAPELRLGTRGSQLALWQANTVAERLRDTGRAACRVVVIKTSGDRLADASLSAVGGKRLFVKEIEDALLRQEIDVAVHSSKDMPAVLPDGLTIGAALPREDPLDAIVLPQGHGSADTTTLDDVIAALGASPAIGTSSVRRMAQLSRLFARARFAAIRGNLDTRLRKLDHGGEYDAIVLAAAGLRRLGLAARISATLPSSVCVPAPGQGIVAVEIRVGDQAASVVHSIDDPRTHAALVAEREVVRTLGGGCQTPIGALAAAVGTDEIEVEAVVTSLDGTRAIRARGRGKRNDAAQTGASVGTQLLANGAGEILAEASRAHAAVEGLQP